MVRNEDSDRMATEGLTEITIGNDLERGVWLAQSVEHATHEFKSHTGPKAYLEKKKKKKLFKKKEVKNS